MINKNSKIYLLAERAILLILFAMSLIPHIIAYSGKFKLFMAVISVIGSIFIGLMSFGMFILAISDYRDKLYCKMLIINFILLNLILLFLKVLAVML